MTLEFDMPRTRREGEPMLHWWRRGAPGLKEAIKRQVPRGHNIAIVGPALVYADEDAWSVFIATGKRGGKHNLVGVQLGTYAEEIDRESPLYQMSGSVLMVRRMHDLTQTEAEEFRRRIMKIMSRICRAIVLVADTDLKFARLIADRFPSEDSRRVLTEVETEFYDRLSA